MQIKKERIEEAIRKIKVGKSAGVLGVVAKMVGAAGDTGVELITSLVNQIVKDGIIPNNWQSSVMPNCFMGKSNASEKSNLKRIKVG